MSNKLETMDAETLMTTPLEQLKFIVDGLMPQILPKQEKKSLVCKKNLM